MLSVGCCSLELEAQRDKRERDAWEREMRDMRELEFMEKLKQEMELKLPGLYTTLLGEMIGFYHDTVQTHCFVF